MIVYLVETFSGVRIEVREVRDIDVLIEKVEVDPVTDCVSSSLLDYRYLTKMVTSVRS